MTTDKDTYDYYNELLAGVYTERAHMLSFISTWHETVISYNDPKETNWAVLYMNSPTGQMTWHIAPEDMHLFNHVLVVPGDDPRAQWDGHDNEEKYKRFQVMIELAREVRTVVQSVVASIDLTDPALTELKITGVYDSDNNIDDDEE